MEKSRVAVPGMEGRSRILHGHSGRRLQAQTGRVFSAVLTPGLAPGSFPAGAPRAGGFGGIGGDWRELQGIAGDWRGLEGIVAELITVGGPARPRRPLTPSGPSRRRLQPAGIAPGLGVCNLYLFLTDLARQRWGRDAVPTAQCP